MKAVVQRVKQTTLKVEGETISSIPFGLTVFLGIQCEDTKAQADYIIKKIAGLRIFEDENGKMNLSVKDVGGEVLLVSQFTLYANTSHGNRPSFFDAEAPDLANEMYLYVAEGLKKQGLTVKLGVFGADMKINQTNDGPFTIILEKLKK